MFARYTINSGFVTKTGKFLMYYQVHQFQVPTVLSGYIIYSQYRIANSNPFHVPLKNTLVLLSCSETFFTY